MVAWPAELPDMPLWRGLSRTRQKNYVDMPTDVGPGKRRRRSTGRSKTFNVTFSFTAAQFEIFDEFYDDETADGSLPFTAEDPATGDDATFYFQSEPVDAFMANDCIEVSFQIMRFPA